MSKMPAKKKSCFQITSVTTAQVASSITEDTESLDDPDESRTEDVSSEIFDVSRATDYGHEDDASCQRSSSEETLNNVGADSAAVETPGTVSPNLVLDGQLAVAMAGGMPPQAPSSPANGGGGAVPRSAPPGSSAPLAASSSASAACSSRFRVIKLDHGSGEPYRRGRWTCMEYYDRDSDGAAVLARTGDCIRHNNNSTFEQVSQDRDSGLGATGGSLAASGMADSLADSSLAAVSQLLQPEKISQPLPAPQQQQQQPGFVIGPPPQQQQPIGGAVPHSTAPLPPQAYSGAPAVSQQVIGPLLQTQAQQGNAQNMGQPNGKALPPSNVAGLPMPPPQQPVVQQANVPVAQAQPFAYPQSQIPPVHLVPTQAPGQTEYIQHMSVMPPQGAAPGPVPSGLPAAPVVGQNPSAIGPVMGVASQAGETVGQGSGLMQSGLTTPIQAVIPQPGGVVQQGMGHAGVVQQKSMTQQQMGGSNQVAGAPHTVVSGVQNVPAAVPGTSVPSVCTTSVTMPNASVTLVQSQLTSHTSVSRSSSVVQQHVGLPLMQGATNVPTNLLQSNIGQFQTQPLGQIDDTRRKSEPLPQPPLSLVAENKLLVKPPIPDTLTNPLNLPATTPMNSLASSVFGISIPVDGDEDSASGASVVAIDNKIEQAMDLVKSHLMYAVREEVEVLKEQIKELVERNSLLERENALLKSLSNNDQLSQLSTQQANPSSTSQQQQTAIAQPQQPMQPPQQPNVSSA
ncbi:TSC22 domain family protein 2 isoform X2 [Anolis carolinensis]|uniref:TSC22 domain family member 2 n=1 Tax=Anolis carolinensis TaxID=28377 RepID=G1KGW9_ANOCA|nr:PREDICTED: TSC22 domain family protein 2 isoform X2 [Anolis carolinensis]|eukprot:XP_008104391.1 PREDICTED: TSC22 domain family protein 2 isoform X2 [Anolis carolinensis]